jgi:universal stress protein E
MKRPKSILVVIERTGGAAALLRRSVGLARALHAKLELFLCDSEQAFVLGHAYAREGVLAARAAAVAGGRAYLSELREAARVSDVDIAIDAQCESPLYESVVRKVLRSAPDLVVKAVESADPNDWQLIRTCPVTLMLSRTRHWRDPPRFAAAIDVSEAEPEPLARSALEAAAMLSQAFGAELHAVYAESESDEHSSLRLAKLHRLCDEAGLARERAHVLTGTAESCLHEFARRQGFDALVLGALAHRAEGITPVGTLTSKLLDELECDFILVKPPRYRSPVASIR